MAFSRGHTPWNRGLKGVMPEPWNKGTKGLLIAWNKGKYKMPLPCEICKKETPKYHRDLNFKHHFCSRTCYTVWRKEHFEWSDEVKKKISLAHTGRPKKYKIWNDGLSKENSEKMKKISLDRKGKGNPMFGRRNYNFRGISPLNIYIRSCSLMGAWKQEVFHKFNYTCNDCKDNRGGNLIAHHAVSFKQLMKEFLKTFNQFSPVEDLETLIRLSYNYKPFWDVENGVCLCEKCHKKIHSKVEVTNGF